MTKPELIEWTGKPKKLAFSNKKIGPGHIGEIIWHETGSLYLVQFLNQRFYAHLGSSFKKLIDKTFCTYAQLGNLKHKIINLK